MGNVPTEVTDGYAYYVIWLGTTVSPTEIRRSDSQAGVTDFFDESQPTRLVVGGVRGIYFRTATGNYSASNSNSIRFTAIFPPVPCTPSGVAPAPQKHTNYVGITSGALSAVAAADFTVSGATDALLIPAYTGTRRLLFARPASVSDPSEVYMYRVGGRNTVNQKSVYVKSGSTIQLGGVAHNWWGTVDLQNGFGGYVLEQVD